jgi:predicted dehydrogenase
VLYDTDIQTLRKLVDQTALGEIKEAEIHYGFESPAWLAGMTEKEYTPDTNGFCFR